MKKSKNKTSDLNIDPFSFEGLASFEEIDSYELLQIDRCGKKYKIERRKGKAKNEAKEKGNLKDNCNADQAEASQEKEKKDETLNKRKVEAIEDENCKRQKCEQADAAAQKCEQADAAAWKSIFVPDVILEAITELGFKEPTLIQKLSIPAAIKGHRDILGAAETGSGKTLAFMIPIISGILKNREKEELLLNEKPQDDLEEEIEDQDGMKLEGSEDEMEEEGSEDEMEEKEEGEESYGNCVKVIDDAKFDFLNEDEISNPSENKLRALVITPTRELAVQIKKHTDAILSKTDIKAAVVIGGLSHEKQLRVLNRRPEIVIGTPGRLWEMIEQENPHLSQLEYVRYLAIDETDRMLEKGHFEELQYILQKLNYFPEAKQQRQNFVFSATLTMTHEAPKRLNKKKNLRKLSIETKLENFIKMVGLRSKPKIIDITRKFGTAETLSETKVFCEKDEKDLYLYYFLKRFPGRTLIFCNSISCVKRLSNVLTTLQCKPQSLHASKHQKQRLKSLERFASDQLSILLSTDVAARGIDIPGVKHIIHYEVPQAAETYVHRSGRTARANQEGVSVLLISSDEIQKYRQLCVTLNRATDLPNFPIDQDTLENVRERVQLARKIEVTQYRTQKQSKDKMWLDTMQNKADFAVNRGSDDDDEASELSLRKKKSNKELQMKKLELSQLLSESLLPAMFSGRYPTASGKLVLPQDYLESSSTNAIDMLKKKKTEVKLFPKVNKVKSRNPKWKKKFKKNKK